MLPQVEESKDMQLLISSNKTMYAYIQNEEISFVSQEIIENDDVLMIEYDNSITDPVYVDGVIQQRTFPEIEQRESIRRQLIEAESLDAIDLEWVLFSDIEIGEIIRSRVFAGNPYAEAALQAKTSAYLLSVILGNPNEELLVSIQDKQARINEVRAKLNLTII